MRCKYKYSRPHVSSLSSHCKSSSIAEKDALRGSGMHVRRIQGSLTVRPIPNMHLFKLQWKFSMLLMYFIRPSRNSILNDFVGRTVWMPRDRHLSMLFAMSQSRSKLAGFIQRNIYTLSNLSTPTSLGDLNVSFCHRNNNEGMSGAPSMTELSAQAQDLHTNAIWFIV